MALAASLASGPTAPAPIFKFDTFEKFSTMSKFRRGSCDDRPSHPTFGFGDVVDATGGEFSPASGRSPHSSLSSPQVNVDSPRICFSPLKIKDAVADDDDEAARGVQR
jgi:hypothetical protein